MRRTHVLASGAAAVGMTLGAAPAASAADTVFGGSTSAREAIVIKADKAGKKLSSAVIAWTARCGDGSSFPLSTEVRPSSASPGFAPAVTDLLMARNRKGQLLRHAAARQRSGRRVRRRQGRPHGAAPAEIGSGTLSAESR